MEMYVSMIYTVVDGVARDSGFWGARNLTPLIDLCRVSAMVTAEEKA